MVWPFSTYWKPSTVLIVKGTPTFPSFVFLQCQILTKYERNDFKNYLKDSGEIQTTYRGQNQTKLLLSLLN